MNRYYEILQSHLFVARSTSATPPAAASEDWKLLGNCPMGGRLTANVEIKERIDVKLGQRLKIREEVARDFTARVEIEELNKLVMDMIFRSNTTATDDIISHGSTSSNVWIQFQAYNRADANRVLVQGYGLLIPTGDVPLGGEDFFKAEFEIQFSGKLSGKLIGAYPA